MVKIIMKRVLLISGLAFSALVSANCDLSLFRWGCDLKIHPYPTHSARSLVYCGNAYGYVSPADYTMLQHYQRANVDFVLKLNGEFIEGPCVPGYR